LPFDVLFMPRVIADSSHRPWPIPGRPWMMSMRWEDLLFMHWSVPFEILRALVPAELELEVFEGRAWLGIVPFRMCATRVRHFPLIPTAHAFPELNVRTYVQHGGKRGVWFFSLDAGSAIVVQAARRFFHLPYVHARMSAAADAEWTTYRTERLERNAGPAEFRARYRPIAPAQRAPAGSLAQWLTERYCLYSADRAGNLWRGEILHEPWPLQEAEAEVELNTMARPSGIELPTEPPLLHFSRRLEVVAWLVERIAKSSGSPELQESVLRSI
jgi:uncharacterized protein